MFILGFIILIKIFAVLDIWSVYGWISVLKTSNGSLFMNPYHIIDDKKRFKCHEFYLNNLNESDVVEDSVEDSIVSNSIEDSHVSKAIDVSKSIDVYQVSNSIDSSHVSDVNNESHIPKGIEDFNTSDTIKSSADLHFINLPKRVWPKTMNIIKAGLERQFRIQKYWNDNNIYEKICIEKIKLGLDKSNNIEELFNNVKIILDGPPYANGRLHYGHFLNKTIKDIILRFLLLNNNIPIMIPGWDCHGIPIEIKIMNEEGHDDGGGVDNEHSEGGEEERSEEGSKNDVNTTASISNDTIPEVTITPPEVQSTSDPTRRGASSNYLSLKRRATPGDRGVIPVADLREAEGEVNMESHHGEWKGTTSDGIPNKRQVGSDFEWKISGNEDENVGISGDKKHHNNNLPHDNPHNPREIQVEGNNVTSSGKPVADLREAEGEVIRRADGRNVTSGRTTNGMNDVLDRTSDLDRINRIRSRCSDYVSDCINDQMSMFKKFGIWALWNDYYATYHKGYEKMIIDTFMKLKDNNLIYRDILPQHYSTLSKSVLSDSEIIIKYKNIMTYYISFDLIIDNEIFKRYNIKKYKIIIWTDMGWTIFGNKGLGIDKNIIYSIYNINNIGYIISNNNNIKLFNDDDKIDDINGSDLIGLKYYDPIYNNIYNIINASEGSEVNEVIDVTEVTDATDTSAANIPPSKNFPRSPLESEKFPSSKNFPSTENFPSSKKIPRSSPCSELSSSELPSSLRSLELPPSTGIIHLYPAHNINHFYLINNKNINFTNLINENEYYYSGIHPLVDGKHISIINPNLLKIILNDNLIKYQQQSIPINCDWRFYNPTHVRLTKQWCLNISNKDKFINTLNHINMYPKSSKNYIYNTILNRKYNWCISRQRYWGINIPNIPSDVQSNSPPEVQSTSLRPADSSSNYLSLKGIATPGDRGEVKDVTSSGGGIPGSDLRELEGEINRESHHGEWKGTTSGGGGTSDIFDIWFESGLSWLYTNYSLYNVFNRLIKIAIQNNNKYKTIPNFDFIINKPIKATYAIEGQDQHRGWYQSIIILHTLLNTNNNAPVENIITHGFVVDKYKQKFSKSKQNNKRKTLNIHSPPHNSNSTVGIPDNSSPPEVQSTSLPLAVEASPNYLSLKSRATPGDRGGGEGSDGSSIMGMMEDGSKDVLDVTSGGLPVADLREAEGEVNKEATTASGRTSNGEADGRMTSGVKKGSDWTSSGVDISSYDIGNMIGLDYNNDDIDLNYVTVDTLRVWVCSNDFLQKDIILTDENIKEARDFEKKVVNIFKYLMGFIIYNKDMDIKLLNGLDIYFLKLLYNICNNIKEYYIKGSFSKIIKQLEIYITLLSNIYITYNKNILYIEPINSSSNIIKRQVLNIIMDILLIIISPIMPHLAEDIYQTYNNNNNISIFNKSWPIKLNFINNDINPINTALIFRRIINKLNPHLEDKKLIIYCPDYKIINDLKKCIENLNVDLRLLFNAAEIQLKHGDPNDEEKQNSEYYKYNGSHFIIFNTNFIKCKRCWLYREDVDEAIELCKRCEKIINMNKAI